MTNKENETPGSLSAQPAPHIYASILDAVQEAVICIDSSFNIWFLNRAAEELLGWSRQEVSGKPIADLLFGQLDESHKARLVQAFHSGQVIQEEFSVHRRGDAPAWVTVTGRAIQNPGEPVEGYLFSLRDCSERRQLEAELEVTHQQLTRRVNELEAFFGVINDALLMYYTDGRVKANQAAVDLFGFDPGPMSRENALRALTILDSEGSRLSLDQLPSSRALRGEKVSRERLQVTNALGKQVVVLATAAPFYVEGEMQGVAVIWQEITEREKLMEASRQAIEAERDKLQAALAALQESEDRFRQLADSMPQLVWTARPDGTVDYYNRRYQEFSGISPKAGEEWKWSPVLHPDDVKLTIAAWKQAVATGEVYQVEHRAQLADGSYRWQLSRGVPVRDSSGQIIRWYGTATDIHEHKTAEEAMHQALQRAEEGRLLLEAIMENIPDGLAITGGPPDFPILKVSRYGLQLSGRVEEEIQGVAAGEHIDILGVRLPDGVTVPAPESTPIYRAARFGETVYNQELVMENTRGRKYPVLVNAAPIRNTQGEVVGAIKCWRDITERRASEQALLESEYRFRRLVEGNIIGIIYRDRTGLIYDANQAFLNMIGCEAEDLHTGTLHWKTITPPEYWDTDLQGMDLASDQGACKPYEKEYLTKDGRRIPVMVGYASLDDKRHDYIGFILDLSEQKKNQIALQTYAEQLERSNRELEEFAFVASHDLQEPLRKIRAFGENLMRTLPGRIDENEQDYLERMVKAAGRMQRMVEDLLALSRVTTRARPFRLTSIAEVVQEALSNLDHTVRLTEAQVRVDELPYLIADPSQMRQLFQNLIGNALKYRLPGEPPQISIRAEGGHNGRVQPPVYTIVVEDRGIGFDPHFAEQIFQPFQRLSRSKEYEGTGIGLAICRKIVERHGGQITAESQPGQGSRFIVRLPASRD
jgi:PAS domain S-box-containing protein